MKVDKFDFVKRKLYAELHPLQSRVEAIKQKLKMIDELEEEAKKLTRNKARGLK